MELLASNAMNSRTPRKLLIDTDTASDDAVALIMALRSPEVSVLAITVVAGNVPVEQATQNALYTVELCASTVPVFSGAAAPLIRPLEDAVWFHGRDGLGDHGYQPAAPTAAAGFAVDAIVRTVAGNPGIEIITLGPLTNLALALRQWPQLAGNVSRCVVMGGAPCCEGNVTPAAEFNFWVDPEAARVVLRSQLPIELVGWQLSRGRSSGECRRNGRDPRARDELRALRHPVEQHRRHCLQNPDRRAGHSPSRSHSHGNSARPGIGAGFAQAITWTCRSIAASPAG